MKATINGVTYEGTEDEIRRIVSNPPPRPAPEITCGPPMRNTSAAYTVKCTQCGKRVEADEAHYILTTRGVANGRNATLCHDCYKRAMGHPWLN